MGDLSSAIGDYITTRGFVAWGEFGDFVAWGDSYLKDLSMKMPTFVVGRD
jgi:hypothetical protein